ncbi:MAG: hypothetical protein ACI8ZF_000181 [Candidatus Midichloriaceae bacterium]|jgi:hypothetical protein
MIHTPNITTPLNAIKILAKLGITNTASAIISAGNTVAYNKCYMLVLPYIESPLITAIDYIASTNAYKQYAENNLPTSFQKGIHFSLIIDTPITFALGGGMLDITKNFIGATLAYTIRNIANEYTEGNEHKLHIMLTVGAVTGALKYNVSKGNEWSLLQCISIGGTNGTLYALDTKEIEETISKGNMIGLTSNTFQIESMDLLLKNPSYEGVATNLLASTTIAWNILDDNNIKYEYNGAPAFLAHGYISKTYYLIQDYILDNVSISKIESEENTVDHGSCPNTTSPFITEEQQYSTEDMPKEDL